MQRGGGDNDARTRINAAFTCYRNYRNKISVLVLLDLSAAFDTVDHNILLERLENWVGLSGMALKWFRSYLEGRGYYVSIGEHRSNWTAMTCGVPQGSILAPLLFSLYMLPLSQIMRKNQIAYHSYADDTQIYLALSPNDYSPIDSLCQCIDEINSWMCQNFLQLNKEKTEVIAFRNKDEVLKVNAYLDSRGQTTKNQIKNLGVILETDLSERPLKSYLLLGNSEIILRPVSELGGS